MNILYCTSEVAPFSKTGGLADVGGSLPPALARLGHEVCVITPAYRQVWQCGRPIEPTEHTFDVPIGSKIITGRLLRGTLPEGDVPVYFVEQDDYFDRAELYREKGQDYKDNCERFVFYCRAAMEAVRLLELNVDVVHCNDWQTALIPAFARIEYAHAAGYENLASIFTIHNMAYQGQFWHWDMLLTGLDWKYFNWHQMEFYGQLNLLKTGLVFTDAITTVSPRYAREIQTHEQGFGLEGVLQQRHEVVSGILNGADYGVWNPATDDHLAATYSVENWQQGKAACKAALQRELNLPELPAAPLMGFVGRLADQKGLNLVAAAMRDYLPNVDAQWVVLGTGEPGYHDLLANLAREWPGKLAVRLEFSDALAHRIEAGADMFLMPSQYEPCGLNQLYSLKYGAVPVVRATGGLADTIVDANNETIATGTANGFTFEAFDARSFQEALGRACDTYAHRKEAWQQIVTSGMKQDWSWSKSARQYVALYEQTVKRRQGVCV